MLRAFSSRKSSSGYDRLEQDSPSQPGLTRARSVPPGILLFGFNKKAPLPPQPQPPDNNNKNKNENKKKSHPLFSIFEGRWRKKKVTGKPEVARYMEYLKEGGRWDRDNDKPVMHYSN